MWLMRQSQGGNELRHEESTRGDDASPRRHRYKEGLGQSCVGVPVCVCVHLCSCDGLSSCGSVEVAGSVYVCMRKL